MRITNKIMQNNSMYNINNNKITEDDYSTKMATGKKISRPSDDPVIAIRALRLRSTVTQLDQFYEKNSKDAESWLQVTEDALTTITDVLTDAKQLSNQGANKDLTIDDLNTIVTQLKELSNEYYSTGNVDFADRYIFTGYRTNTPLSFDQKTTANYVDINDEFNATDITTGKRVVNLQDLKAETVLHKDASGNYDSDTTELDIQEYEVGRLRLSYDNLDYEDGTLNAAYADKSAVLKFRENLKQSATSTISNTELQVVALTFQDKDGIVRKANIPVSKAQAGADNTLTYDADGIPTTLTPADQNVYSVTIEKTDGSVTYRASAAYKDGKIHHYDVFATAKDIKDNIVQEYRFKLTDDGVIDVDTDPESPLFGEMVLERYGDYDSVPDTDPRYGKPKTYVNQAFVDAYTDLDATTGVRTAKPTVFVGDVEDLKIVKEGAATTTTDNMESTASYSDNYLPNTKVTIPLLKSQDQQYKINIERGIGSGKFDATVNSDGTFTISNHLEVYDKDGTVLGTAKTDAETGAIQTTFINMTANGSISSSYTENDLKIDNSHMIFRTTAQGNESEDKSKRTDELAETELNVDWVYQRLDYSKDSLGVKDKEGKDIADDKKKDVLYLNADTGEILMSNALKERLASLKTVLNANTIDVVYDKKEWTEGDIQPQHLFSCRYVGADGDDNILKKNATGTDAGIKNEDILYNGGFRGHDIQYDVGYNQRITVNTTADTVFTANVKRDVDDLTRIMDQLNQVNATINTLKDKLSSTTVPEEKTIIQNEIDAANKAFDYLRTDLQKEFEHKITSMSEALDAANVAVTQNGTRSKRLELIKTRLQNQTTTFKTLQSENEDADIAETATGLTVAQTTYQASLIATGKIGQTSLMDYI